ncbi:DNA primase [candidate division WOR-3 bacterium]|nr:DNA primase [candidate division WOR-3 bacterium]
MLVSDEVINQIKEKIEITHLIGDYLPLKKAGKNYVANCPFHKDDTPSFHVSPALNIFHCFGCGKSGDVISFVMEFEKVPFTEAVRILAERAGIKIGKFEGKNEILYSIHDFAVDFYHKELLKSPEVLNYLKKRALSTATIEEFKIGFAPYGSNFLPNAKKEFKIQDLVKSGLVKKSNGGIKDTFFLRLLFPLFSTSGRVIGFGGRRLSKKGPKYLNSPDTPIHKKGKNLYSLHHAKEEIRKTEKVLLVEGYFDFLSLYQSGIKNAVACLGTSLTTDQAELISRYAKEVVLFFDEDNAGKIATLRSLGMLLGEGINVKIGKGGEAKDPDEIIVKEGKQVFEQLIKESDDFMDWMLDRIKNKYKLGSPIELSKAVDEIKSMLEVISDSTKREIYKDFIARKLAIRNELLAQTKVKETTIISNKRSNIGEAEELELDLIFAMLEKPEESTTVFNIIKEEHFQNPHLKQNYRLIKEGANLKTKDIINSLPTPFVEYVMKKSGVPVNSVMTCAISLKKYYLNKLIEEKITELQKIDDRENKEKDETLLCKEIDELKAEREQLKKGELLGR